MRIGALIMAVAVLAGYRWSGGAGNHYVCDTEAELPAESLVAYRDTAYTKDSRKKWVAASASTWESEAGDAGGSIPAGLISMWHGALANIPSGWVLCDGQNGTPDLRDKFVKGAAAAQNPGGAGGALTHGHAAHASHTHQYTEVPNHVHQITDPGHTHVQNAHNHVITSQTATTGAATSYEHGVLDASSAEAEATETTNNATATNQNAATGITGTQNPTTGVATGTTQGPSASLTHDAVNHEPPYFTVAFIMKT